MNVLDCVVRKSTIGEDESFSYELNNRVTGLTASESGFDSENEARLALADVIGQYPEDEENTDDEETPFSGVDTEINSETPPPIIEANNGGGSESPE